MKSIWNEATEDKKISWDEALKHKNLIGGLLITYERGHVYKGRIQKTILIKTGPMKGSFTFVRSWCFHKEYGIGTWKKHPILVFFLYTETAEIFDIGKNRLFFKMSMGTAGKIILKK